MSFWDKLLTIDRRVIYLLVFLAAIIPFMLPSGLKVNTTKEVLDIYDFIEGLPSGTPILLAADYDPQTQAENGPQAKAVLRHMFKKNLRVVIMTLSQDGAALAEMFSKSVAAEYDKKVGVDYTYLGYKPYPSIIILSLGQDFRISYPKDFYNVKLDDIPMMKDLRNLKDLAAVIEIGGGNICHMWLTYAHERYQIPLALGVTAVSGPQYYPFLQSGQLFGLMGGLKGAAEYETLMEQEYIRLDLPSIAIQGMNVQNYVHVLIVALTVIGNIAFFAQRRRKRAEL
jgi:hypothetical protein